MIDIETAFLAKFKGYDSEEDLSEKSLQKWLCEVCDISIIVKKQDHWDDHLLYECKIQKGNKPTYNYGGHKSYNDALAFALRESLKL